MKSPEKIQSIPLKTLLLGGGIIVLVLFLLTATISYFFSQNSVAKRIRGVIPYPALVVDHTNFITFRDVDANVASIRRFYESQSDSLSQSGLRIDFTTQDGQKRLMIREKELLNKMVEDKAIQILAQERNISIPQEVVSEAVTKKIATIGNNNEDVAKQLDRLYGWTLSDFETKIVQPEMYRDALAKAYEQNTDTSSHAKKIMESAAGELKQGTPFDEVAKKYSEGQTAQDGGELGWIATSTLSPEIALAIKDQKLNRVTGNITESALGFHIVMVEERKQENNQEVVRLKQIFAKKSTFGDWLSLHMKQMNVTILFKGYMWDKDTARIEFKQPEMKSFEENILKNSQGDASLLF